MTGVQNIQEKETERVDEFTILAQRFAAGDKGAYDLLYKTHIDLVRRGLLIQMARVGIGRTQDAEDLAQEVFVGVWNNIHKFDPTRASFTTWVLMLAYFKLRDFWRDEQKKREVRWQEYFHLEESLTSQNKVSVAHKVFEKLLAIEIAEMINDFPDHQKIPFLMQLEDDLKASEVARRLKKPPSTIRSAINKLKQDIKKELERKENLTKSHR